MTASKRLRQAWIVVAVLAAGAAIPPSRAHGYGWTIVNDQIVHQQDGAGQARVALGGSGVTVAIEIA